MEIQKVLPLLLSLILEVLTKTIRQNKELKGIQIRMEEEKSVFADDIILQIENLKPHQK